MQPMSSIKHLLMRKHPYDLKWHGIKPFISHFRTFGYSEWAHAPTARGNTSTSPNYCYTFVFYSEFFQG